MKGIRIFAIIVLGFIAVVCLSMLTKKRSFEWEPTFGHDDAEPFGCQLFDRMVTASMGDRYTVQTHPLSFSEMKEGGPKGWLIVTYRLKLTANEMGLLMNLAREGHCVMIASTNFGQVTADSLDVWTSKMFTINENDLEKEMGLHNSLKDVVWTGHSDVYPRDSFPIHSVLQNTSLMVGDSLPKEELARHTTEFVQQPVAVSIPLGRGKIVLVSMPLLFTNYGMLSGRGSQLIMRLLSQFGDMPVRRVPLKTSAQTREEDPLAMLDYINTQPPLRWAWRLAILLILLFMLTNARRRQRAIPVVGAPQNHALEFVRLIGTLYNEQGNHADLVEKKFRYTAEHLRRRLHIDITDPQDDQHSAAVIAQNTSLNTDEAEKTIKDVRKMINAHLGLTAQQMREYIDRLNALTPP
ncbi:MAG: hypothetical protein IKZ48_00525 [Prevotella sp.]|nr:hypothetical protein [Prevotella sp.]